VIQQSRRERARDEYRKQQPQWKDSLTIYRDLVWHNLPLGGTALDLGTGTHDWLAKELTRAGLAVGLDADLRTLRGNATHMQLLAARADRLPFSDGVFDLVTMAWLLERLRYPPAVLREVRRVLRPGGRLVFTTANAWNYNVWMRRLLPNPLDDFIAGLLHSRPLRYGYPVHYRPYSPRQVELVLTAAGFRRRELLDNGDPSSLGIMAPLFRLTRRIEQLLDRDSSRLVRPHLLGVYEAARQT
jgi:SAM-dependent methyltransferase